MVNAYEIAAAVADPELPMLTLADLGILREVTQDGDTVTATITPTYSGCPAMREISDDVRHRLQRAGFAHVTVRTQLAPAWTTDWISAEGRRKLAAAGIAPPGRAPKPTGPIPLTLGRTAPVRCPRCGSERTVRSAAFGATACKSLHRCVECSEPFEHVKAI
jgi:ring-1,2-phenylacetyl-CoA epoxidase subunit PaaD